MKIAVLADIHDNMPRLEECLLDCKKRNLTTAICLGDISRLDTLERVSERFKKVYIALGNMDFNLKNQTGLFPENVTFFGEEGGEIEIAGKKIFIVHYDFLGKKAAETEKYDIVFYGHTHTPWEKKIKKTVFLNPGEISGQFGPPSFAVYDLSLMKAELVILK